MQFVVFFNKETLFTKEMELVSMSPKRVRICIMFEERRNAMFNMLKECCYNPVLSYGPWDPERYGEAKYFIEFDADIVDVEKAK